MDLSNSNPSSESDRQVVRIFNPCYPKHSRIKQIEAANGDAASFAARGIVGRAIRAVSGLNAVPNPLGLSHSGIVVLQNPQGLFNMISELTPNSENKGINCTISEKAGKLMLNELLSYHRSELALVDYKGLSPFLMEANGTAGKVLRGIAPHVEIHPLANSITEYDGNVYLRSISGNIPVNYSTEFIRANIGRSYETFSTLPELALSAVGGNKRERTDKVFCSELVGLYYRGVIRTVYDSSDLVRERYRLYENVSNIIPEQFGSGAGDKDLLRGLAGSEIEAKYIFNLEEEKLKKFGWC
jgi:hypothetical protein